jgi:hypothetical protein
MPFAVPMKSAQPRRSESAGRMTSPQTLRRDVGHFVDHDAVEAEASERVSVVGAEEPDARSVRKDDLQFALANLDVPGSARVLLQEVPGDALGLLAERRDVGEAPALGGLERAQREARGRRTPSCRRADARPGPRSACARGGCAPAICAAPIPSAFDLAGPPGFEPGFAPRQGDVVAVGPRALDLAGPRGFEPRPRGFGVDAAPEREALLGFFTSSPRSCKTAGIEPNRWQGWRQ